MVFDKNAFADTGTLSKEHQWIDSVVQNVNKHYDVETLRCIRNRHAVERMHRHKCRGANQDVHPHERNIRPLLLDKGVDRAVATTDVQNAGVRREETTKMAGQDSRSPAE